MVRLHAAHRDEGVGPLVERAAHQQPHLAHLVAAHRERNRIVTLDEEARDAGRAELVAKRRQSLFEEIVHAFLGIGEHVSFVSGVSQDELIGVMGSAEIACVPSLYEGFGLPVLEAMASGVPIGRMRLTEHGEVLATRVKDAASGTVEEPSDPVRDEAPSGEGLKDGSPTRPPSRAPPVLSRARRLQGALLAMTCARLLSITGVESFFVVE